MPEFFSTFGVPLGICAFMTTLSDNLNEATETGPLTTSVPPTEGIDAELETKLDQHDIENEPDHEEDEEHLADYSHYTLAQLAEAAVKSSKSEDIRSAHLQLKAMRQFFDSLYSKEYNDNLHHFIEEGNIKEDFAFKDEHFRKDFYEAYKVVQQKRSELKAAQDAEKLKNLEEKKGILDKIKELIEGNESEHSLKQLKDLQNEWKRIRNVPRESVEALWNSYHVLLDKFYDKLSIYNELKQLDREKNLDSKIELIKKADELLSEPSLKKAQITLNKYHEEWKNIGPVPNESREDIWQRFKEASDKVYEKINTYRAEMDAKREQNLQTKKALCEKAETYIGYESEKAKEWIAKTKELEALFEEWRKAGAVPQKFNQSIWERFKQAYNQFYINKNAYFKKLNNERNHNLKLKTELCEKAEELANQTEWNKTTKAILDLQAKWKTIGPVHDKQSDKIWKRFRAACDTFFSRKSGHFEHTHKEQNENLAAKTALLGRLNALIGKENAEEVLTEVKLIQAEWNKIGFVPMASKEDIQKQYNDVLNSIYGTFRQEKEDMRAKEQASHYELMASAPDGRDRLKKEERFLMDKIRKIKAQIDTEQNNMGFFANSKNASPFLKQIEENLKNAKQEISRLDEKLKLIRKAMVGGTNS